MAQSTLAQTKQSCGCPRKYSNEPHNCAVCRIPIGDGWVMFAFETNGQGELHVCENCRDDIKHGGHREVVTASKFGGTVWIPRKVDVCEKCNEFRHVTEVNNKTLCAGCSVLEVDENACEVCGFEDGTHYEGKRWICDGCTDEDGRPTYEADDAEGF